jgi:hypothetical protein
MDEVIFSQRPIGADGLRHMIAGLTRDEGRVVEIALVRSGQRASGLWLRPSAAPLLREALRAARAGQQRVVGFFPDGELRVRVSVGEWRDHTPGMFLQRVRANDDDLVARTICLTGRELDAIEDAIEWATSEVTAAHAANVIGN